MKKWNDARPVYNYCACMSALACRMQLSRLHVMHVHMQLRHMHVDVHVGGDHATCPLTRHTLASLATHVGTAMPAGTASACAYFLRLQML
jgi:hypothetical protein